MICPICHFNKSSRLLNLNCGNIDGSILYPTAKITACRKCGHIFNILSPKEISNLKKYYDEESAPVNIGSPDKVGDKTGNMSPFTLMRYNQLYKLISPYTKKNDRVLDCGCATGGFLEYLSRKGFDKLAGFEISATYRDQAAKWKEKIKVGDMDLSIPFPDSSADFLVADQVIEHLSKPRQAFKEARRVLGNGGFFCISVPDALRYSKNYFFDFYWFLLREHICHFDIEHLKLLAALEGFELVTFARYDTPMMTEKMILPILTAIFRSTSEDKKDKIKTNQKHFLLKRQTIKYIKRDLKKLKNKKNSFFLTVELMGEKHFLRMLDSPFFECLTFSMEGFQFF